MNVRPANIHPSRPAREYTNPRAKRFGDFYCGVRRLQRPAAKLARSFMSAKNTEMSIGRHAVNAGPFRVRGVGAPRRHTRPRHPSFHVALPATPHAPSDVRVPPAADTTQAAKLPQTAPASNGQPVNRKFLRSYGAGDGNRTRIRGLGSRYSTTEPRPPWGARVKPNRSILWPQGVVPGCW
jgi:hypothetical protein